MAGPFKMKGSPVKLGTIQGTAGHASALKKMGSFVERFDPETGKTTSKRVKYEDAQKISDAGEENVKVTHTGKEAIRAGEKMFKDRANLLDQHGMRHFSDEDISKDIANMKKAEAEKQKKLTPEQKKSQRLDAIAQKDIERPSTHPRTADALRPKERKDLEAAKKEGIDLDKPATFGKTKTVYGGGWEWEKGGKPAEVQDTYSAKKTKSRDKASALPKKEKNVMSDEAKTKHNEPLVEDTMTRGGKYYKDDKGVYRKTEKYKARKRKAKRIKELKRK